jgi:hypothetical protein
MRKLLLPSLLFLLTSPCLASFGTPTISSGTCASAAKCAITVKSTGAGHLLIGIGTAKTSGITITGMSGGSTGTFNSGPTAWYHPAGGGGQSTAQCAGSDSIAGSADCAYILVSTSGATTVSFTFSGTTGGATCYVIEVPYTAGPIQAELPMEVDRPASTSISGATLWLGGANDFVLQAIRAAHSVTAVGGGYAISGSGPAIAYLSNTTSGTAPAWTQSALGPAAVFAIAFAEYIPVTGGLSPQWIIYNRAGYSDANQQCAVPADVSVASSGSLNITSRQQSHTCASIDLPPTSYSYTSGMIAMRSFNFLYGTIEFRAKFSGGNATGSWPIVLMYDAVCQESDPTGTDNNCDGQEVDIAEFLNSRFTAVNEQIHVSGGRHNDQCLPAVTDASQHYHTYDLVWSTGSLVFSIDGTTTCTIRQAYVPNAPMYLKIDQFVGGTTGGRISYASLPWTLSIDYIKVIQNDAVVFEDDFSPGAPKPR